MPKLLLIGLDPPLAESLGRAGHQVLMTSSGRDGLRMARERRPALIALRWTLPDLPGASLCRELRASPELGSVPLVGLSAWADELERVVAFEVGVDDYVLEPFSIREVLLRVQALLRRSRRDPDPEAPALFGCLTIQRRELRLWVDEEEVTLTAKEFQLLLALYDRRGQVRTRELLLREVWRRAGNETRTVDTHVTNLREKLGRAAGYLQTVRGIGYRFADTPERGRRPAPIALGSPEPDPTSGSYALLVIDPDGSWRERLREELDPSRCHLHQATSGAAGLREAERLRPQVVIIDSALPDLSASDVCRQLRLHETTRRAVVIVTSRDDDEIARVVALELGADDHLRKPIGVRELALRIESRVRDRFAGPIASVATETPGIATTERPRYRVGDLELEREAHQAFVRGQPVPTSAAELRLLLHLYDRRGAVSTRGDIAAAVWNRRLRGSSRAVDTLLKRLRQKLGPASALIETVRGTGYRMQMGTGDPANDFPSAPSPEPSPAKEVTQ